MNFVRSAAITALFVWSAVAFAAERATLVRSTDLHSSPGSSDKIMTADRGADLSILEERKSDNESWIKVSIAIPGKTQNEPAREATGWIQAKPVVSASSQNGDQIVYGEAVDSEQQAEQSGGRKGAAQDAMRLYYEVAQVFPNSPLAAESLWRSADIRRQLAKEQRSAPLEDAYLNDVISRFPHTKWADMAAFDLLDSQMCGDWNGLPDCPLKESAAYEQYAREHRQSPRFGEAIFNAAYRQAAVADIYRIMENKDKSKDAHNKALSLAQELAGNAAQGEWSVRAMNLIYKLQHDIPVYGAPE
ncbi:MAG TPA: hypothetical protein VN669_14365 [Candidatus Acidoferrales bacterium]|nr:hypothetical protein [Candidatus Acidoferrales bacterium]